MRATPLVPLLLALFAAPACKRKHLPAEGAVDRPYPTCADAAAPRPELAAWSVPGGAPKVGEGIVAALRLRAEDTLVEEAVQETYAVRRRDCHWVITVRQEWFRQTSDVEVVFDADFRPLRAWKRMTIPGSPRPDGHAETRSYELRGPEVLLKVRDASGKVTREIVRGKRPFAVIGPGRALFSAWIRASKLEVGQKVRGPVLDFRERVELIRDVTLRREEDRLEPSLHRTVRVYTVYGRESVFTDENGFLLGDLAGLRPNDTLSSKATEPMPLYGTPDPILTP